MRSLALFLLFLFISTPSDAQSEQPDPGAKMPVDLVGMVGAGGIDDGSHGGFALPVGIGVRIGRVVANFVAADLTFYPGDSYPYYRDSFSNGQSRCRNSLNGQFADDSNCLAIGTQYAYSVEAGLGIPKTLLYVGGGRRFDDRLNPWFASGGLIWLRRESRVFGSVRADVGDSYFRALAAVSFRLFGN